MQNVKAKGCRGENAVAFGDGSFEDAFATDQLKAGLLRVPAGGKAGYDAGHPGKDEVFYVVQGRAVVDFPTLGRSVEMEEGDFLPIPRDEPHEVRNPGDKELILLYANCDV